MTMNEILLADDEVTFRETFAKVLREEGRNLRKSSSGRRNES
jgi:CheY-like chemotaxis protein